MIKERSSYLLVDPVYGGSRSACRPTRMKLVYAVAATVLVTVLFVAGFTATRHPAAPAWTSPRLPRSVIPHSYMLHLWPNISTLEFTGDVHIAVEVLSPTNTVVLHAVGLDVRSVDVTSNTSGRAIPVHHVEFEPGYDYMIVHCSETLAVGQLFHLAITFAGKINDGLEGFYHSAYDSPPVSIATTQFEAVDARRAFPCFDEPAFKATFQINIFKPAGYAAVSNEVETVSVPLQSAGIVSFRETPIMSTYLVAYVLCPFAYVEGATPRGQRVRVWARPERVADTEFALNVTLRALAVFEQYFGINYTLSKLDLLAIPDFAAGAMENWGCITYGEEDLLINNVSSNSADRQLVARVVVHELGHQWFGNLVTMAWWNNLWLNEGFATFLEVDVTAELFPEWGMWVQFVVEDSHSAKVRDMLASTHALSLPADKVVTPAEINSQFDSISYSKGGACLRMLQQYITPVDFQHGLHQYLLMHEFGNAVPEDLWAAFGQTPKSLPYAVDTVMEAWTRQPGYPLVKIERTGPTTLSITQARFGAPQSTQIWLIPVRFLSADCMSGIQWLNAKTSTVQLDPCFANASWVLANPNGTGFFRVDYVSASEYAAITAALPLLSAVDRAVLVDDAFALAEQHLQPITAPFDLTRTAFLAGTELDFAPWMAWVEGVAPLEARLVRHAAEPSLTAYLRKIYIPAYMTVMAANGSSHLDRLVLSTLATAACAQGVPTCVDAAQVRFDAFRSNGVQPDPDLQYSTYVVGVQDGSTEAWDAVFARFLASTSFGEKNRILRALGQTSNETLLRRYLSWTIEQRDIRKQDASYVLSSVGSTIVGSAIAWQFLKDNWSKLYDGGFGAESIIGPVLSSVSAVMISTADLADLEAFFNAHEHTGVASEVTVAVETIKANIAWVANELPLLLTWLAAH